MNNKFRKHFFDEMKSNNLNTVKLSKLIGVARTYLSAIINGAGSLTYDVAKEISIHLNLSTLELLLMYGNSYDSNIFGYNEADFYIGKVVCSSYCNIVYLIKNDKKYKVTGYRFFESKIYFQILTKGVYKFISINRFDDILIEKVK